MKMEDYRELVKSTHPCDEGWKWFLEAIANHKTTDTFFDSFVNTEKAEIINPGSFYNPYLHYNQHGYLIYMFRMTLDWAGVTDDNIYYNNFTYDDDYRGFISKHFGSVFDFDIPIPMLINMLKDAFK